MLRRLVYFCRSSATVTRHRSYRAVSTQYKLLSVVMGSGLGFGLYVVWNTPSRRRIYEVNAAVKEEDSKAVEKKKLPVFTRAEVESHASKETGIWVTYRDSVYDITEFVDSHPGGSKKIMLAAGKAIDPFWSVYQVHLTSKDAKELLDEMLIGRLDEKDVVSVEGIDPSDVFSNEPWKDRSPLLKVNSGKPFNAEPPLEVLADNFYTPNSVFFVRNHLPVPKIDIEKYRVEIEGEGLQSLQLSFDDLKTNFPQHTISATMQCAGNRRSELSKVKTVRGLEWGQAAISTATWTGVRLRDILLHAGYKPNNNAHHVEFIGMDKDMAGEPYAVSIPVEKAMSEDGDVLLAYEMNGEPLPLDHGFPIRVVVPGSAGARNCKWLSKIVARKDESDGFWQQNDYKVFDPSASMESADFQAVAAIQETPVQSAITEPLDGSTVAQDDDIITVKGYAFSGGGRGIMRIDLSVDNGKSWQQAELQNVDQGYGKQWAWTLWSIDVPIPKEHPGHLDICCKAVDSAINTQPEKADQVWNFRGLINNSWHQIQVRVERP